MSTLAAKIELRYQATLTAVNSDSSLPDRYKLGSGLNPAYEQSYSTGTGTRQGNLHYHKAHSLAAAGTVTIDLNAAVDERGTYNFANVRVLWIRLRTPATATKVVVGNAAANPWAPWLSDQTKTEDVFSALLRENPVDGWAVPAAANLKITNPSAGAVIVDVSILGNA